jgi:hypothetical protein
MAQWRHHPAALSYSQSCLCSIVKFEESRMGIKRFSFRGWLAPLQALMDKVGHKPGNSGNGATRTRVSSIRSSKRPTHSSRPAIGTIHHQSPRRPLRVIRVLDAPQKSAGAGRMLISGCMADVCAELERLAALEAAASQ